MVGVERYEVAKLSRDAFATEGSFHGTSTPSRERVLSEEVGPSGSGKEHVQAIAQVSDIQDVKHKSSNTGLPRVGWEALLYYDFMRIQPKYEQSDSQKEKAHTHIGGGAGVKGMPLKRIITKVLLSSMTGAQRCTEK